MLNAGIVMSLQYQPERILGKFVYQNMHLLSYADSGLLLNLIKKEKKDGSRVKSTCCSSTGPRYGSQHPHVGS